MYMNVHHTMVFAHVAMMEEEQRRDEDQQASQQRPGAAQPALEEQREEDHQHAEDGRIQTAGEVVRAKQGVHQRVDVEEDRPMHQRRMLERAVLAEQVRVVGVQAFVVAHHAVAQSDEARDEGDDEDRQPGQGVPVEANALAQPTGERIASA
jgi:hypothetical protein